MRRLSPLLRFLGIFVAVYGALIAPWPAWSPLYASAFRSFCGAFLATESPTAIVRFQAAPAGASLDTQIVTADPRQTGPSGKARARVLGLDSRGVGWIPTAFLCALVLASPVPWPRRLAALGLGLVAIYAYLVSAVWIYIWNRTLPAPPPGAAAAALKWVAGALEETMITQLGPSFAVPAVLWILVTFRQEDFEAARNWLRARIDPAAPPGHGA